MIVYTTEFGRTHELREPQCVSKWRFVCFTDQPIKSQRWQIVRVPSTETPTRECRKLKQRPHVVFPDASISLWIDCNVWLMTSPEDIAAMYGGDFTAFRHYRRSRITDECEAIIQSRKGKPDAVRAQLAAYQADGFDTDRSPQQGLHNGGMLLRRHTAKVIEHAEAWHHEVQTRTLRDQMSLDYTAQKVGLKIREFPGAINNNAICRITHSMVPTNDF